MRASRSDLRIVLGFLIVALFVAVAVSAPLLVLESPTTQVLSEDLRPPSMEHPCDQHLTRIPARPSWMVIEARVSSWAGHRPM